VSALDKFGCTKVNDASLVYAHKPWDINIYI